MRNWEKALLGLGIIGGAIGTYYLIGSLGRKSFAIVYWKADDLPTAYMLRNKLSKYYNVRIVYAQENPKADFVIQLGSQYVNPVYKKYMQMGKLAVVSPNYRDPGPQTIGNTVFLAGYTKEDTYNIALRWVKQFLGVVR